MLEGVIEYKKERKRPTKIFLLFFFVFLVWDEDEVPVAMAVVDTVRGISLFLGETNKMSNYQLYH